MDYHNIFERFADEALQTEELSGVVGGVEAEEDIRIMDDSRDIRIENER
jgi:hypothetical protein